MNLEQINGVLRVIVPAGMAYLVGKGWIAQEAVGDITAAIVAVASAVWSFISHADPKA